MRGHGREQRNAGTRYAPNAAPRVARHEGRRRALEQKPRNALLGADGARLLECLHELEDAPRQHTEDELAERIDTRVAAWVPSPEPSVERIMLDRDGDEVARATSIVRYAPGSRFNAHEHGGGEEILVLEGDLADEHGRYGAGTWVRQPPGSAHTAFTECGCLMWTKRGPR